MIPAAGLVALLAVTLGCALPSRPAWELPPPPVRDAPVVDAARLSRVELDNGLHVIVLEDRRLPRFELGLARGIRILRGGDASDCEH